MTHLIVKNVGPITSADVTFNKCTIFIGEQGAGKSTLAKLFSMFTWIEKGLLRHTLTASDIVKYKRFKNKYASYHNLDSYFSADSYIQYIGEHYVFIYENEHLSIERTNESGEINVAKVMYIPAERNLLSVIESSKLQKGLSESMQALMEELNSAKTRFQKGLKLPVGNLDFTYDRLNQTSWLKGENPTGKPYKVLVKDASSGFQSLLPMVLVSNYLSEVVVESGKELTDYEEKKRLQQEVDKIMAKSDISEAVKNAMLRTLSSRFKYSKYVNVVEELEQNLYPLSQKLVLFDLLRVNQTLPNNMLVMTTHSPYLISYLTIVAKAADIDTKIPADNTVLRTRLYSIVPKASLTKAANLSIYELQDGKSCQLNNYNGIPSDDNFLNQKMIESNDMFDELLDIEELISHTL